MGSVVRTVAPIAGGVVGAIYGGPAGAAAGYAAGSALGNAVDPLKQKTFQPASTAGLNTVGKQYAAINSGQLQQLQNEQQALNGTELSKQLAGQAAGTAPSIAEAQLKSATNRNLAQQLAAAASMRGRNPAAQQRQVLNAQGDASRQLAEQSAAARLIEQQQAMQLAMNQNAGNNAAIQQNITSGYGIRSSAPLAAIQAQQAANSLNAGVNAANVASQNQMTGSLIGAGAQLGAAYMGSSSPTTTSPSVANSVGSSPRISGAAFNKGGVVYKKGGVIKGKEVVKGDSPKNDIIHVMASAGEGIIPKSHMTNVEKATQFVQHMFETQKSDDEKDSPNKLQNKLALALNGRK